MYYNKEGKKISREEWAELFNDEYKIIKQECISGNRWLSTIYLGLEHGFDEKGRPLIFETMLFPERGNFLDELCVRYATLEEAIAGHERIKEETNFVDNFHEQKG